MDLTEKQSTYHHRLNNDLRFFSQKALVIKDKAGMLVPFIFNDAQAYIDERLEQQLQEHGRVRALILKGRQQGCSTYTAARYYHKTTRNKGKSTFILSHESQTTEKLYQIVERYHENCPPPLQPEVRSQNRRQMRFDGLESEYTLGTAGNEKVGRGGTLQLFHGSEVAFWENTDGLVTGVLQSVADSPGTEVILESTANGMGNLFYFMCMDAVKGVGDYQLIFTPWYWQKEYYREPPKDMNLTEEELELKELYFLTDGQLYWRRKKIAELKSESLFKQEYPFNVKEAFQSTGERLISAMALETAARTKLSDTHAPLVYGVDAARKHDRIVLARRRGREMLDPIVYDPKKGEVPTEQVEMWLAGIIASHIDRYGVQKVFFDAGNGYGCIDRLHERGYQKEVEAIHFGSASIEPDVFKNKRAEMAITFRDWVEEGGVSMPDNDALMLDVAVIPDFKKTSNNLIILVPKDKIIKDCGFSPDIFDATMLTFAFPVKKANTPTRSFRKAATESKGGLTTTQRRRGRDKKQSLGNIFTGGR
jgi:hypothetical protein